MDIDRLKKLIEQREAIDAEIVAVAGGTKRDRAPQKCGTCGAEGHTSRTCTAQKELPGSAPGKGGHATTS